MGYDAIENCQPIVEIAAMEPEAIEKALVARTKVWTALLRGESERWTNIEELRNLYRTAAYKDISAQAIRVRWEGSANEFGYPARLLSGNRRDEVGFPFACGRKKLMAVGSHRRLRVLCNA
jgi:hypothetical protein